MAFKCTEEKCDKCFKFKCECEENFYDTNEGETSELNNINCDKKRELSLSPAETQQEKKHKKQINKDHDSSVRNDATFSKDYSNISPPTEYRTPKRNIENHESECHDSPQSEPEQSMESDESDENGTLIKYKRIPVDKK
ncbi:hypothetical protein LOTGIDRAFT_177075, partial [Lottia gigantea]